MLTLLKGLGKALLAVVALVILYLAAAVLLSLIPTSPDPPRGNAGQRTYIASNGVHTDFVLPRELVPAALLSQLDYLADYPYLAFGWGDKGFYLDTPTWADLKASTAIRAMLLPSPTAMHVTGYRAPGAKWATLDLTDAQVSELNDYILASFRLGADNRILSIDADGYGDDDEFYEALGSYNAIYTCNNWINGGLKRIHVRTALWSPSEWGIMRWRR